MTLELTKLYTQIYHQEERIAHLEAVNKELVEALEPYGSPAGPDNLDWVADRLVYHYGENPNVDFVVALHRKAKKARTILAKAEGAEMIHTPTPWEIRRAVNCRDELVEALREIEEAANRCEEISPGWLLGVVTPVLAKATGKEAL